MLEVIILATALSMDAFAVSIGLGTKHFSVLNAAKVGAAFGLFQGVMPLIGYWGGKGLLGWLQAYTPWVAFFMLLGIGIKMIYEGMGDHDSNTYDHLTHRLLLTLAVATSIDAMAAGFTLNLIDANPYVAVLTIGVITACFSFCGVFIGARSGTWLESRADIAGGVVLILLGIKLLVWG